MSAEGKSDHTRLYITCSSLALWCDWIFRNEGRSRVIEEESCWPAHNDGLLAPTNQVFLGAQQN